MKKLRFFLFLSLVIVLSLVLASCNTNFKIEFMFDGAVYATVKTKGEETIKGYRDYRKSNRKEYQATQRCELACAEKRRPWRFLGNNQ